MEKETVRIIMMKNGETVIDETNPQSVILSITQKESPKKIAQQMMIIGHPKDVFTRILFRSLLTINSTLRPSISNAYTFSGLRLN